TSYPQGRPVVELLWDTGEVLRHQIGYDFGPDAFGSSVALHGQERDSATHIRLVPHPRLAWFGPFRVQQSSKGGKAFGSRLVFLHGQTQRFQFLYLAPFHWVLCQPSRYARW